MIPAEENGRGAVYLDGALVEEANVALTSPGFAYAVCVFEGIPGYCPEAGARLLFRADDHVARLFASMDAIGLAPPWSAEALVRDLSAIVAAHADEVDFHLRIMVWPDGPTEIGCSEPVRTGIVFRPLPNGRGPLSSPATVRTSLVARAPDNVLPASIKATANYLNGRRAVLEAKRRGAEPALVTAAGCLAEGPTANLFLVRGGRLITPSLDQSILPGITRDTIIVLAARHGIETEERAVAPEEAQAADEAFFTGSLCEVRPIASFDGMPLRSTAKDSITSELARDYGRLVRDRGTSGGWVHVVRSPRAL